MERCVRMVLAMLLRRAVRRGAQGGGTVTGGKASVLPSMQSSPSLPPDPRAAAGRFVLACIVFSHRFGSAMLWHAPPR